MPAPTDVEAKMGVKFYSAMPDLTKMNFDYMMKFKKDSRVQAAWTIDGRIKKLTDTATNINQQLNDIANKYKEKIAELEKKEAQLEEVAGRDIERENIIGLLDREIDIMIDGGNFYNNTIKEYS